VRVISLDIICYFAVDSIISSSRSFGIWLLDGESTCNHFRLDSLTCCSCPSHELLIDQAAQAFSAHAERTFLARNFFDEMAMYTSETAKFFWW
jgi:hypothetical protein